MRAGGRARREVVGCGDGFDWLACIIIIWRIHFSHFCAFVLFFAWALASGGVSLLVG